MKILLSAYACAPNYGSEPAAGWNFAEQLAKQGHQVTVLTNDVSKDDIERFDGNVPENLTFVYYRLPFGLKSLLYRGTGPLAHIYYFFWQIGSFFYLKGTQLHREADLIHLITLGVFRTPVFLGLLGKPFVLGPVGGGENSTPELRRHLPVKWRVKEKIRHWLNLSTLLNPLMYITFATTDLILLKTKDNLRFIPGKFHAKCKLSIEVGIDQEELKEREGRFQEDQSFKILFAGRLEYWKGVHLAIRAYAEVLKKHPWISFTIVGSGKDEAWFRKIAKRHGVLDKIEWLPRVPQRKLFQLYQEYDVFLFPSMHDSSGGVVVEALSFGLAVVCLDLGGPKEITNESCGRIISTKGFSEQQVVEQLSHELTTLITQPALLAEAKKNALERARLFSWEQVVKRNYGIIEASLNINTEQIPLSYAPKL